MPDLAFKKIAAYSQRESCFRDHLKYVFKKEASALSEVSFLQIHGVDCCIVGRYTQEPMELGKVLVRHDGWVRLTAFQA